MMPHSSCLDFVAVALLGLPSCVARHQSVNAWLVGKLICLMQPILVNREQQESRQQTALAIKSKAEKNEQILLFPEGTCTNREMIIRFRLGAFLPGKPVQAIYLKYNYYDNIDNVTWTWEGASAGGTLLLTLMKWKTDLKIIRLPIYEPGESEKQNPM
ncbi:lysophosphatidylcholine acyltransferase 2-like protein [Dinothrombium tinctorium]|uniref:Lysophosphatidylcholine acyltransferase 2-like protein n=1 Tax=Dinothrombium tinctorium TaxID=1965070 RepID=A0A3S3PEU3_9ACAR|nr:lysophosphatidylcholine acyltransferase 2-like protein [Dinothrombium tinctorium]